MAIIGAICPNIPGHLNPLTTLCRELAIGIVRGGEGATKLVTVVVSGAASASDARRAAKAIEPHKGPADYAGLWEQWAGADTKTTGPTGPPGPEVVALAIARAIEDPATPLRVPVGQDAEMILGMRRSLDDQALEDAMRKALGITW